MIPRQTNEKRGTDTTSEWIFHESACGPHREEAWKPGSSTHSCTNYEPLWWDSSIEFWMIFVRIKWRAEGLRTWISTGILAQESPHTFSMYKSLLLACCGSHSNDTPWNVDGTVSSQEEVDWGASYFSRIQYNCDILSGLCLIDTRWCRTSHLLKNLYQPASASEPEAKSNLAAASTKPLFMMCCSEVP